jgi:hypothetical protein
MGDLGKAKSLDDYLKKVVTATGKGKTDYKAGPVETATIGGTEGKVWTYEYKDGEKALKVVQWVVLKDKMLFILQGTALADTYDATKPKFDEIVASFKFSTPGETGGSAATGEAPGATPGGTGTSGK